MKIKHIKRRKPARDPIPDWLRNIQLNSWEAELLISALLLYALFQVPDYILLFFRKNFSSNSLILGFGSILTDGINLLKLGYIMHIIVRGVWVASVGFSFVFPKGIVKEKTRFKGKFKEELEKDKNLHGFVLQLEQLSSMIYGLSFMIFGLLLGGFSFFIIISAISMMMMNAMENGQPWLVLPSIILLFIFLFLGLVMIIDFLSNGFFRREKSVTKWFYPLAKYFRFVSFSILYRRSLLVLLTNLPVWWRRFLPVILITIVGSYIAVLRQVKSNQRDTYYEFEAAVFNSLYYETTRDFDEYLMVTIPDQYVERGVLELFVKDINLNKRLYAADTLFKIGFGFDKLSPKEQIDYLFNRMSFTLNDTIPLNALSVLSKLHSTTYIEGYQVMLDLSEVYSGSYELVVQLDSTKLNSDQLKVIKETDRVFGRIPFIYQRP